MSEHTLDRALFHHDWDNAREPVLAIQSGDTVHLLDLLMSGDGQVTEDARIEDIVWNMDAMYNLAGPILVEGAKPGDTLKVEILSLTPGPWGWTSILPGFGLLPDDFPEPHLRVWDLRNGETTMLGDRVRLPLTNFLGVLGVELDEDGPISPFPPNKGGGNMDTRHLVAGSTLWLPIWCDGALFSCGDPHAGQGDGEVCVSAIECPMQASLRLSVERRTLAAPSYRVPASAQRAAREYHGTMGIDGDLLVCSQKAVRAMIAWIVEEYGLAPVDAYMLTSAVGDLHIHEIVDAGVWNVGMTVPLDIFV